MGGGGRSVLGRWYFWSGGSVLPPMFVVVGVFVLFCLSDSVILFPFYIFLAEFVVLCYAVEKKVMLYSSGCFQFKPLEIVQQ